MVTKDKLDRVIVIIGPTASGKSNLAIQIAKNLGGEIVSADSRQVYRGMDIGTAKPSKDELAMVEHHLIDIKNPDQNYDVSQFKRDALRAIKKILAADKTPIVVGGTGLYVDAIVKNLTIPQIKANKKLRAKLEKDIEKNGLAAVFKKLVELDPEAAYIVDPNNPRRVIRALEVAMISGKPFSSQRQAGRPLFDFFIIGTRQPVGVLKDRIAGRVHQMMADGLLEEVKTLVGRYGYNNQSLDAIGYREIIDYLKGKITLEESVELMIKNTWHYARRQLTWFNRNSAINWLNPQDKSQKHKMEEALKIF